MDSFYLTGFTGSIGFFFLFAAFGGIGVLSFLPRPPRFAKHYGQAGRTKEQQKIMSIPFILSNTWKEDNLASLPWINLKGGFGRPSSGWLTGIQ
jgi:hypothetical protein